MDFLGSVVDIIRSFWDPISQQFGYFKDLDNNVEKLTRKTAKLKRKRDEIQADVDDSISVGKRQKLQVENWLAKVRQIETKVDSIRYKFALRRICTDPLSRYKLGKRVVKKLKYVKKLKVKGVFDEVAESPRRPRVLDRQPSLPRGQSTSEQTMEQIWQCLHGEENGIIGVYGMGGIGKTTLMKAINNRFIGTNDFNVVIWVTVSKDLNLPLIQEKIGSKLEIRFENNEDITVKRDRLFTRLKNVRYLLILDDLWKSFNLDQVGIPKPDKENRCKIAITTRSIAVCDAMGADEAIKVTALTWEEAWNLFCKICGNVVQSSEIQPVAKKVAEECGRLPLAIKTVGGSMRRKDRKELWENALRALKISSPEIPEDYEIRKDEIVRYWAMEEGFIKNVNNLEETLNKGHGILERIKDACLLEEGFEGNEYVRMHDLLRDLAIWITSPSLSSSIEGSKFFVQAGEGLVQPPEEKMWREVVRISLISNKIEDLRITPDCPNLVSLFLNDNDQLHTIHSSFFELMPKLQILDLSNTCIKSLPVSLLLLVNLRALILSSCKHLVEVPPLGKLKELRLLDLSKSGLKKLPQGIESLVKLKRLDLSYSDLAAIPCNMIYGLPSLEDLSMLRLEHVDGASFGEAVTMTHLSSLRISLSTLNGFIAHDMFCRWFSGLRRFNVQVVYKRHPSFTCHSDKEISICGCDNFPCGIERLIKHAISLCLNECKGLTSLSQLVGDSKSLRHLEVSGFCGVECIIDWREVGDDALQCLQQLHLFSLPNLEKVFNGRVPRLNTRLQNLRIIWLSDCPKLRCLLSSSMVEHLNQLEELYLLECPEMEEIIEGNMLPENSLPRLRFLWLRCLSKLACISSQRFIFISLEEIAVISCPMLKKLPLFCSSIHEIKGKIVGEREWWEGLEWEDENAKLLYSRIYKNA